MRHSNGEPDMARSFIGPSCGNASTADAAGAFYREDRDGRSEKAIDE